MATTRNEPYHQPVMVEEVVKLLLTNADGVYIDLTVGTGGHLRALAEASGPHAKVYGVDKDENAVEQTIRNLAGYQQVKKVIRASYREIDDVAEQIEITRERGFNGILIDTGFSSQQLDDPARGFSFTTDGPLDMRFDRQSLGPTAADLISSLSEHKLSEIIRTFGEERLAPRIARAVVRERQKGKIQTTGQLARLIRTMVPSPHQTKSLARVFQALRIAVNHELEELEAALPDLMESLEMGGRMAVISFQSLEDRLVKRAFRKASGKPDKDEPKSALLSEQEIFFRDLTGKPDRPSREEVTENPRSRSAKLRVLERL